MRDAVALLSLVLATASAATVDAAPKKGPAVGKASAPACGIRALPLAEGNTWTYVRVPSMVSGPPDKNKERITPPQPIKVVVAVTGIEVKGGKGGDTVATLEETVSYEASDPKKPEAKITVDRKITSTVTCNAKKFEISPESFFFAGEPGGFHGLTLGKVERSKKDSVGWKLEAKTGSFGEVEWIDELVATWTQEPTKGSDAKLTSGKIEIERKFTPQDVETVSVKKGTFKAEKLGVVMSGRVRLESSKAPEGKPCVVFKPDMTEKDPAKRKDIQVPVETCDLPAGWIAQLWLADDVGMVQALNGFGHQYQLSETNVAPAAGKPAK